MGFFVYRHLGLVGCNIVLMKRFLPLLVLTGLLFGQDVLILKSGESYNGKFIRTVGLSSVVFQVEGENDSTKFPMKDVAIIKTGYGFELESELTYPFNPNNPNNKRFSVLKKNVLRGCGGCCLLWILLTWTLLEGNKM